jgi:hypothetical protein
MDLIKIIGYNWCYSYDLWLKSIELKCDWIMQEMQCIWLKDIIN